MWMEDLQGPSDCNFENSGVIVGNVASVIRIHDSKFSGNDCSYVYSDRTPVEVKNTIFTNGLRQPYINIVGSMLTIVNSTLSNALNDPLAIGRGVKCTSCTQVFIKDSVFEDLYAQRGGAIYLENSFDGLIYDSNFTRNSAF